MKILVKYPSRGRPTWFFKTLDLYWRMISGRHDVCFLVAMDEDDVTMNNDLVKDYLQQISPPPGCSYSLEWFYAEHEGKVAAVNSGVAEREFDIVIVISDDIEPTVAGYDDIIAKAYMSRFPGLDGLVYFQDGRCGPSRIQIAAIGKKFFDRFGWIIHPEYIAWGDDYMTKCWKRTKKVQFVGKMVLEHKWKKYIPRDKHGRRNDSTSVRAKHLKTADYRTSARLLRILEHRQPLRIDWHDVCGKNIPECVEKYVEGLDFSYYPAAADEAFRITKKLTEYLDKGGCAVAGSHRREDWEKGWRANLRKYKKTRDINRLIPGYYRKPPGAFRYCGQYIIPNDRGFQLNVMRTLLIWLGSEYMTDDVYEFGCGSGYNLAYLALAFPDKRYFGLDWATASQEILKQVDNTKITGIEFDMTKPDYNVNMAEGSTVFTFGGLEQLGSNIEGFVNYVKSQKPAMCVHIEPLAELYDTELEFDRIAHRYHCDRGYLRGLLPLLSDCEVLQCRKIIGDRNCDCWSLLVWRGR